MIISEAPGTSARSLHGEKQKTVRTQNPFARSQICVTTLRVLSMRKTLIPWAFYLQNLLTWRLELRQELATSLPVITFIPSSGDEKVAVCTFPICPTNQTELGKSNVDIFFGHTSQSVANASGFYRPQPACIIGRGPNNKSSILKYVWAIHLARNCWENHLAKSTPRVLAGKNRGVAPAF